MATRDRNFDSPFSRTRIFVGMKRVVLRRYNFDELLRTQARFSLPYRFIGFHDMLTGRVTKIVKYPEGDLVMVRPEPDSMGFRTWDLLPLWVSSINQSGILATWDTNTTPKG